MRQLVGEEELLEKTVRISSRRLKDYRDKGVIPFIKTSRSVLYDPEKVLAALEQFEVKKARTSSRKNRSGLKDCDKQTEEAK
jgi:hypothetical protein